MGQIEWVECVKNTQGGKWIPVFVARMGDLFLKFLDIFSWS
jgi:hypothetical protein